MFSRSLRILAPVLLAGAAAACSNAAQNEVSVQTRAAQTAAQNAPAASVGMRVHKDPVTGEFAAPPQGSAQEPAPSSLLSSPGQAQPELIVLPNGTLKIELRGRAQRYSKAIRNPDGTVTIHHDTGLPPANTNH
jgi:hypothetical protein